MVSKTTLTGTNPARTNLLRNEEARAASIKKLASGKKINRGSDDPAALGMIMAMESQTRGLYQETTNRQDEISLMQTAEGSLDSTSQMLQRISELSVTAANGTLTTEDRANIQLEVDQLKEQINQNANNSTYNTKNLLDGSLDVKLQNGQNFSLAAATTDGLGISDLNLLGVSSAESAMSLSAQAISQVSSSRAAIGANINGIGHEIAGLEKEFINTTEAQSRIQDVDMAAEIIRLNLSQLQSKASIGAFKMQEENRRTVLDLIS